MEIDNNRLKLMYDKDIRDCGNGILVQSGLTGDTIYYNGKYTELHNYKVRDVVNHSIILEYNNSGKTRSKYIIWNVDNDREFRSGVSVSSKPIVKIHKNIIVASLSSGSIIVLNSDLGIIFNYKTDKSILRISSIDENNGKLEIWIKEQGICLDEDNDWVLRTESKKLEANIIGV